jgi:hypothetical protein
MKIRISLFVITPLLIVLTTCSVPNFALAKKTSLDVMNDLCMEDWECLWSRTSSKYRRDVPYERMKKLQRWVDTELGTVVSYEQTYFYAHNNYGQLGGFFIKSCYDVVFEKGKGEIEMILTKEDDQFKIVHIDFSKKPDF